MRKTLFTILAALLILCTQYKAIAQVDPHFSQYYSYGSWLNPALTGVIDGDYRVMAIYRNQWSGISKPFATPGVSADINTNSSFNVGFNVFNETAGDGGYNFLNSYITVAFTGIHFGRNGDQHISIGYSGGVINRRFSPSKFQYGDQWNSFTGYSSANPGSETLTQTSSMKFDAGAGIMYYDAATDKKVNVFAGFSAFHLTQPSDPFISDGINRKIPVRYTAHAGAKIGLSDNVSFTPNLLYMRQGTAEEKMAGAYFQLRANEETSVLLGANYRFKDAIVPYVGYEYKGFVLGASYDVNASDLGSAAGKAGSFELSLTYISKKEKTNYLKQFTCPRF